MKTLSRKNPFRIFYLTNRTQIKSVIKFISLIASLAFIAVPLAHALDNALANRAISHTAESLENLKKMWHIEADLQSISAQNQKNLHAAAENEREFLRDLCERVEFQNPHCWEIKKTLNLAIKK
jgi:hypothetical protein